jgi:hypothetical protein
LPQTTASATNPSKSSSDVAGQALQQQPFDVVASAVHARSGLLDDAGERLAAKSSDPLASVGAAVLGRPAGAEKLFWHCFRELSGLDDRQGNAFSHVSVNESDFGVSNPSKIIDNIYFVIRS